MLTSTYVLVLGILKLHVEIPGSTYVLYAVVRYTDGSGARDMSDRGDHVIHVGVLVDLARFVVVYVICVIM